MTHSPRSRANGRSLRNGDGSSRRRVDIVDSGSAAAADRAAPSLYRLSGGNTNDVGGKAAARGSLLWDPGFAQTLQNALSPDHVSRVIAHRHPQRAGARNGEAGIECETGVGCETRLVKTTQVR